MYIEVTFPTKKSQTLAGCVIERASSYALHKRYKYKDVFFLVSWLFSRYSVTGKELKSPPSMTSHETIPIIINNTVIPITTNHWNKMWKELTVTKPRQPRCSSQKLIKRSWEILYSSLKIRSPNLGPHSSFEVNCFESPLGPKLAPFYRMVLTCDTETITVGIIHTLIA